MNVLDVDAFRSQGLDIDENGTLDENDRKFLVHDLMTTWFGDANLDGEFNSGDLFKSSRR